MIKPKSAVERAARALCENPSEDPDEMILMCDGELIPRWKAEVWRVEYVLQAIREPSEAMMDAAICALPPSPEAPSLGDEWRTMIDAALGEK